MRFNYKDHNTTFDILKAAIIFFRDQKQRSTTAVYGFLAPRCAYRKLHKQDADETCIVGAFIPDQDYFPGLEDNSASNMALKLTNHNLRAWIDKHIGVLTLLQSLHDQAAYWEGHGFVRWDYLADYYRGLASGGILTNDQLNELTGMINEAKQTVEARKLNADMDRYFA
jgi:hypothetical protein